MPKYKVRIAWWPHLISKLKNSLVIVVIFSFHFESSNLISISRKM